MDQELQTALRNLQRAGGPFSQLKLHNFMSEEDLSRLQDQITIARMLLLPVEIKEEISNELPVAMGFEGRDRPLVFQSIDSYIETVPDTLEQVGDRVLDYFQKNWDTLRTYIRIHSSDQKQVKTQLLYFKAPQASHYICYLVFI